MLLDLNQRLTKQQKLLGAGIFGLGTNIIFQTYCH